MTHKKKDILITGFEPFGGDAVNPSALLLEWIKKQSFDFSVYTELLPVSFQHGYPQLRKRILEVNPDYIVLTGFAKSRTDLTLERVAINWIDARIPDNDGTKIVTSKIMDTGEDGLFSTFPLVEMLEAARATGCPASISTSAGEYVCNQLMYLMLFHHRHIPGLFIHIPAAQDHEIFFRGIKSILEKC